MKIILKFERELTVRPGLYIVRAHGALLLVTSGLCKITVFVLLFYLCELTVFFNFFIFIFILA